MGGPLVTVLFPSKKDQLSLWTLGSVFFGWFGFEGRLVSERHFCSLEGMKQDENEVLKDAEKKDIKRIKLIEVGSGFLNSPSKCHTTTHKLLPG